MACPKLAKGVKQIVHPSECIKYEVYKVTVNKNMYKGRVHKHRVLNSLTGYGFIPKDNYSIMSGPFSSTHLRYFSTGTQKWNTKREDDFQILNWVQKSKINKNNKTSNTIKGDDFLNIMWRQLASEVQPKTSINPLQKNRQLLINAKISIFCKYYHVLSAKELDNQNLEIMRRYHSNPAPTIVLKNSSTNLLPSVLLKTYSVITYKSPEKQLSVFFKCYHDWKTPDFTEYRKSEVASPQIKSRDSVAKRYLPLAILNTVFALGLAYGTKSVATHYIKYIAASAEVLALAKVEINVADIAEGRAVTFKWRGKPLFIRHRTQAQIDYARGVDISTLRDPEKDEDRVKNPKWLILIGVCTHLGCVPVADAGDYPGGYYCPCHGSHFDVSGRVRKGPAPLNLEVPPYVFDGDVIIVG